MLFLWESSGGPGPGDLFPWNDRGEWVVLWGPFWDNCKESPAFADPFSPPPSLDDFSGLETDTVIPTEQAYVVYDEGTDEF